VGPAKVASKPESALMTIGLITRGGKRLARRSAGDPHAPFDVAGTGNVSYGRNRIPLCNRKGKDRPLPTYCCACQSSTLPGPTPAAPYPGCGPGTLQGARQTAPWNWGAAGSSAQLCLLVILHVCAVQLEAKGPIHDAVDGNR
jgi:hypothetical protein